MRHLSLALGATAALTALYSWLGVTNSTTVALSFLLIVLVVATVSRRWVAISTSFLAFFCFNFFFLPPLGTLAIADPAHWVALFTLLAVSVVASHLSALAHRRAEDAEMVRRGAELKSALLAALGHDLKTPLTAATLAANNLNATWLDEEGRREQTEIVLSELARLNRLFEDIVDMARIETRAVDAELEWVEPAEIIEAASQQAQHAIASHAVRVEIEGNPVLVRVDPRLMSSALSHLLENAGQYSPPGSTITIGACVIDGELKIQVRDRGRGIQTGDLEHLFERFYRGIEGRQQRFGTGMGLAITRGLLAAQGGRAWADNHPDGGAQFTIAVPAATRAAASAGELA